ncbi:hypothetical protein N9Y45_03000 [Erythrobacter sp.]|nr:hypothetical protein [Erythrobacter sp.]
MAGPLILVDVSPRRAADGVAVPFRLAGGGGDEPYPEGYRGSIVQLPKFVAALDFDEKSFGTGGVATASVIEWAASRSDLANAVAHVWEDAEITVRIGEEGSIPPITMNGRVMQATARDGKLQIALADPAVGLKKPFLRDRFEGTGGLEGPIEWAGTIKPRVFGRVWNLAGSPIDPANNIYCFADPLRRLQSFTTVRDKGAATANLDVLEWQGSAAATLAELQATDAPEGGGVACPSIGCVKWWTRPAGDLTADIMGENAGGYVETTAAIVERVVASVGGPVFAAGTLANAAAVRPAAIGLVANDESTTVAQILDELLGNVSLLWVLTPLGDIDIREWAWGASTMRVKAHSVARSRSYRPLAARRTGYRRNQLPMARNSLAAIVLVRDLEVPSEQFLNSEQQWRDILDDDGTRPEDNATVGAPSGTPVGDRTAEQVTATLDDHSADWIVQEARNINVDQEIDTAKSNIDDLFSSLGSAASAADSATIAQQARDIAQQARDTTLGYVGAVEEDKLAVEGLTTQAINAKTDAVAAKEGAEGAYAGASSERALAAGFKDQAGDQAQAAAGSASTAIAKAGEATARAAESVEARNAAGGHASAASASAATAGQKASEASASAVLSAGFSKQAKSNALSAGMVPNGSFDNGADGWGRLDNLEFEASSNPDYGNNVAPINPNNSTTAVGPLIPVDPTLVYEIYPKFIVHLNGLSMYAGIECYSAAGAYLGAVFLPDSSGQPFNIGFYAVEGRYTGEAYPIGDNVGTSFIAGTRGIRPLLHGNWTGVTGGAHNFLSFGMEEVSNVVAAENQANIATSQAVFANASAAAAEDNKSLSASFASQASQGADAATTQAGIATDQAVVATVQAAAAKQNAVLSASVTGRYLNPNPAFAVYSEPSGNPEGWGYWNSDVAPVRTTNPRGGYALQTHATVSDGGLVYTIPQSELGWCVLEAEVELLAGSYVGSGITLAGAYSIDFATNGDGKGDVSSSKTGIRTFSRLVNVTVPGPYNFHLMHNWGGFGAGTAKALKWTFVGIRSASEAEILAGSAIPGLQASVAINQAAIANAENTAAFLQVLVEASGSNPAIVQLLAGRNGSAIDLVSDVLRIRNKLDGQLVDVATFEGGIARLNAALIRALAVAPTPLSQIFHKVMLEPLRFTGSHDQTIQYQGGAAYESPPTITRDTTGEVLPALPAGEAYDIRPVNITNTSFGIRAVKLVAGGAATQTSAAGSNVGGTPQWRTNKPTSANASSGDYTFSGTVTLSKLGETQILYADEGNPSTWRYTSSYGGQVQLYGLIGSTWTLLATRNLSRSYTTVGSQTGHDATRSFAFNETVNSNADFGSGANRFGVHPGVLPATSITAFAGVTYNTQTTSSEVALGGNFKFVVSPQTE